MDMRIPDTAIQTPTASLPGAVLNCMPRLLLAALPAATTPEIAAEDADTARAMFFALQPRDAAEAAAAARSVAAHFASLNLYARATRPGLSDHTARSLCASANACSRAADAAARRIRKPERKPAAAPPPPEPEVPLRPRPVPEEPFQPRDRFGKPIPPIDSERMTMAQRRARYAWPHNPGLEAIAIAEEEAMIAEQRALEARERGSAPASQKMEPQIT